MIVIDSDDSDNDGTDDNENNMITKLFTVLGCGKLKDSPTSKRSSSC